MLYNILRVVGLQLAIDGLTKMYVFTSRVKDEVAGRQLGHDRCEGFPEMSMIESKF